MTLFARWVNSFSALLGQFITGGNTTTQAEFQDHMRTQCYAEEVEKLPEMLNQWKQASASFQNLVEHEPGLPEQIKVLNLDDSTQHRLSEISEDHLFRKTFSQLPVEFKLVEIDQLVACRRVVNWEYTQELCSRLSDSPGQDELVDFCLSPRMEAPAPAFL